MSDNQRNLIAEAERELTVWKNAHRSSDDQIAALRRELSALKLAKSESDTTNPLLLCLIDGDGCIFNESLLMLGTEGGRDAASKLRQHIIAHYGSNQDLLVNVFFNRDGLGKTLKSYLGIQPATFSAFINGFNTASPLISMLDVGSGKEAADAKIRELMRIFVRYPHVKKIYFGGGHDNGYTTNLATLQNEGYLDKIVLLQSYTQLAAEIKALGLPCLENNGVFLAEKLSFRNNLNANFNSGTSTPAPGLNRSKSAPKAIVAGVAGLVPLPPPTPAKLVGGRGIKANIDKLKALKPRACNHHYLTRKGCPMGTICPYGHEYDFSPDMIADLRDLVKQNPCLLMVKGQECTDAECLSAHQCPQGMKCSWYKENKCKFSAPGMHGSPVSSVQGSDDDRILVAPRLTTFHGHNRTGSSSSSVDHPPLPTPSPGKKFGSAKMRQTTPSKSSQAKMAFKNSVSGLTQKERLAQMGVGGRAGSVSLYYGEDDGEEDQESEETFGRGFLGGSYNGSAGSDRRYGSFDRRSEGFRVID